MIAHNSLVLIAMGIAVAGWGASVYADDDVTVISTSSSTTAHSEKTADSDGTPVVHKSIHKKKSAVTETASSTTSPAPASTVTHPLSTTPPSAPVVVTKPTPTVVMPPPVPTYQAPLATANSSPTVEVGLPVARYPGVGTPIKGVSTYSPMPATVPPSSTHLPYFASAISSIPLTSSAAGSYASPTRVPTGSSDFVFTNYSPHKAKNFYPWKTRIITTEFWIGEGDTPISSTTNEQSSWDEDWRENNHGTDSPYNRNGYASGSHASTLNPFYVALPFNDLAFPDKSRRYLPSGWYRRPKDGKQVSACKDRWVEIKNGNGDVCYAQWEDVGPLRYDHAEYVFGDESPIGLGNDHAGLDVSPAVAEYLGIEHKDHATTSWRFVDDEYVPPGAWLKLDEQAVLYTALHQLKSATSSLPIQKASQPIDDPLDVDANKKKVSAAKG
jgi:hypothetical protein